MYYYVDTDGLVRLLDGDKIASLFAMFIMDLVKAAGVEIKVGIVQTAYANGNSTSYLSKVLVPSPPQTRTKLYKTLNSGTLLILENPRVLYNDRSQIPPSRSSTI